MGNRLGRPPSALSRHPLQQQILTQRSATLLVVRDARALGGGGESSEECGALVQLLGMPAGTARQSVFARGNQILATRWVRAHRPVQSLGMGRIVPHHRASEAMGHELIRLLYTTPLGSVLKVAPTTVTKEEEDDSQNGPNLFGDLGGVPTKTDPDDEDDARAGGTVPYHQHCPDEKIRKLTLALLNLHASRHKFSGLPLSTYAMTALLLEVLRRSSGWTGRAVVTQSILKSLGGVFWDTASTYYSAAESSALVYNMCDLLWAQSSHELLCYLGMANAFFGYPYMKLQKQCWTDDPIQRQQKMDAVLFNRTIGGGLHSQATYSLYQWLFLIDYRRWVSRMLLYQTQPPTDANSKKRTIEMLFSQLDALLTSWTQTLIRVDLFRSAVPLPLLRAYIHAMMGPGIRLLESTLSSAVVEGIMHPYPTLHFCKINLLESLLMLTGNQLHLNGYGSGWLELVILIQLELDTLREQDLIVRKTKPSLANDSWVLAFDDDTVIQECSNLMDDDTDSEDGTDPFFMKTLMEDMEGYKVGSRDYVQMIGLADPYDQRYIDGMALHAVLNAEVPIVDTSKPFEEPCSHMITSPKPIEELLAEVSKDARKATPTIEGRYLNIPLGREGNPPDAWLRSRVRRAMLCQGNDWDALRLSGGLGMIPFPRRTSLRCLSLQYLWRSGGDMTAYEWLVSLGLFSTNRLSLVDHFKGLQLLIDGSPSKLLGWDVLGTLLVSESDDEKLVEKFEKSIPGDIAASWWFEYFQSQSFTVDDQSNLAGLLLVAGCFSRTYATFEALLSSLLERHHPLLPTKAQLDAFDLGTLIDGQRTMLRKTRMLWARFGGHPGGVIQGFDQSPRLFLPHPDYDLALVFLLTMV